jgi:hypothetical protein
MRDAAMDYTETLHDTPRRQAQIGLWIGAFCHVVRAVLRPSPTRPDPQEERMLLVSRHRPPI